MKERGIRIALTKSSWDLVVQCIQKVAGDGDDYAAVELRKIKHYIESDLHRQGIQ